MERHTRLPGSKVPRPRSPSLRNLPILNSWIKEERQAGNNLGHVLKTGLIGLVVVLPLLGLQLQRKVSLIAENSQASRSDTLALMEANLSVASRAARDWGHWDETYGFTLGNNPNFEQNSLNSGAIFEAGTILVLLDRRGNRLLIHTAPSFRKNSHQALTRCLQSNRNRLLRMTSTLRLACADDDGALYLGGATKVSNDNATAPSTVTLAMFNPLVERDYTRSIRQRLETLRKDLFLVKASETNQVVDGELILPAIHSDNNTLLAIRKQPLAPVIGLALLESLPIIAAIAVLGISWRGLAMLRRRRERISECQTQRSANRRIRGTCRKLENLLTTLLPSSVHSPELTDTLTRLSQADGESVAADLPQDTPQAKAKPRAVIETSFVSSERQLERVSRRFERFLYTASDLALLDHLTRLPNRRYFLERVEQEAARNKERNQSFALLFIDVDRFKVINDTYGRETGDAVLITVSRRLEQLLEPGDFLGRYGGDELALILNLAGVDQEREEALLVAARSRAKRMLEALESPVVVEEQPIAVSLSIGITLVPPGEEDIRAVMQRSDLAMYQTKRRRRTSIVSPDDDASALLLTSHELFTDLIQAIQNRHLQVFLQPVVDAAGQIRGVEALARWHHPDQGWIEPLRFLDMADQHRRARQLCDELIRLSLDSFQPLLACNPELDLFLNLSPSQLQDPDLARDLLGQLRQRQLPTERITLELTEQGILEPNRFVTRNLQLLREAGLRLALDDFGTGTSSLMLLKTLRPEVVKIDMGFIQAIRHDAEARHIIELIAELGRRLQLELVAEGIEDEETLKELVKLGLKRFQGFAFGKPLPAQDWLAALSSASQADKRAIV